MTAADFEEKREKQEEEDEEANGDESALGLRIGMVSWKASTCPLQGIAFAIETHQIKGCGQGSK